MLPKTLTGVALTLAVLIGGAAPASAQLQTDAFMLVPTIAGDSVVEGYKDWIDLFSINHAVTPAGKSVGACSVEVVKGIDSAGPRLWAAAVTAQNLGQVQIDIRKPGEPSFKFYELLLTNARITAITSTPLSQFERVMLSADTITLKFFEQGPAGQSLPPVANTVSCK